jgi:cell division protein FtsB
MSTPFFTKYRFLKNKYLFVILFFLVWMAFFDPKDWGLIASRMEKLNNLEVAEKQLSGQISETRAELLELKTSAATIEKYARERFRMKKDNEEVFICK